MKSDLDRAHGLPEGLSERLYLEEQQYISPGLQEVAQLGRLTIKQGRGCWLTDMDGRTYLDLMAGVAVCSLGHAHPKYSTALKEQLDRVTVGSFTTENRLELLRLIASLTPPGLDRIQLYSGGAEAVEAALRLARSYTGKFEVATTLPLQSFSSANLIFTDGLIDESRDLGLLLLLK